MPRSARRKDVPAEPPTCAVCAGAMTRGERLAYQRPSRPARWRWDCPRCGSWASVTDKGVRFAACWNLGPAPLHT